MKNGEEEVIRLILNWFEYLKKVMFLTGSKNLIELKNKKTINKEELF